MRVMSLVVLSRSVVRSLSSSRTCAAGVCGGEAFYVPPANGTSLASYVDGSFVPSGYEPYSLVSSRDAGKDSKLLTFALPEGMPTLGAGVISGVKVRQEIGGEVLAKSYSPSSHCEKEGTFDLLVKAYPYAPGGGMGAFLCDLAPGDVASMYVKGAKKLTPEKAQLSRNRFRRIGMLAGGTGVAPFLNLAATLLADAEDRTLMDLVVSYSRREDAMLREELEALAMQSEGRLRVHHTFSREGGSPEPPASGRGTADGGPFVSDGVGRIDALTAGAMLPKATDDDARPPASLCVPPGGPRSRRAEHVGLRPRLRDGRLRRVHGRPHRARLR